MRVYGYKEEVCAKFAHIFMHGSIPGMTQIHAIENYNLDMIISIDMELKVIMV